MFGYSWMVAPRPARGQERRVEGWSVWGSLARRTKRQLWRDRLRCVALTDLERGPLLGVGGFGRVELVSVFHQGEKRSFALKTIRKSTLSHPEDRRHSVTEKELLAEVDSEFIVKLYRTFQTSEHLHLLLELCQGGELWGRLRETGPMQDPVASFYMACVVEGLDYLHSRGIVYRDLKPENCMLATSGYIKLVDLGLAKRLKARRRTYSLCGTAEYVPPEVILQTGHGPEADLWSLGILIYELVEGRPPFMGETSQETYNYILQGMEGTPFPAYVSSRARNIIFSLCRKCPSERLGVEGLEGVRRHRWFHTIQWPDLRRQKVPPPYLPEISNEQDAHLFDTALQDLAARGQTSGYSSGPASAATSHAGSKVGFIEGWDL